MARHIDPYGDSITYYWRWTSIPTPRALDLHPIVDRWEGPRPIVLVAALAWRHLVRAYVDLDGT